MRMMTSRRRSNWWGEGRPRRATKPNKRNSTPSPKEVSRATCYLCSTTTACRQSITAPTLRKSSKWRRRRATLPMRSLYRQTCKFATKTTPFKTKTGEVPYNKPNTIRWGHSERLNLISRREVGTSSTVKASIIRPRKEGGIVHLAAIPRPSTTTSLTRPTWTPTAASPAMWRSMGRVARSRRRSKSRRLWSKATYCVWRLCKLRGTIRAPWLTTMNSNSSNMNPHSRKLTIVDFMLGLLSRTTKLLGSTRKPARRSTCQLRQILTRAV